MQNETPSVIIPHSSFRIPRRGGYTLIEFFVTIAVLVIVLGLMVDLARRVRRTSADRLTRQLLQQLDALMENVTARHNNAEFVRLLRGQSDLTRPTTNPSAPNAVAARVFAGLPLSLYNEVTLHDPWGSPIVFMPRQHPLVGMAPSDRPFFFSAGPDGKFLSRDDNLYSYEEPTEAQPATQSVK
jgi:type II secretory pathway pseudopilin PulG